MDEATFEWIRVAGFAVAALPALLSNLRSGAVPNRDSAILLLGGVAVVVTAWLLGVGGDGVPWLFWGGAFALLFVLAAVNVLPGGLAKFAVAMLPWFEDAVAFVAAIGIGFAVTAIAGYARGGTAKGVPGLYLAGLGALAFAAAG